MDVFGGFPHFGTLYGLARNSGKLMKKLILNLELHILQRRAHGIKASLRLPIVWDIEIVID